MLHRFCRRRDEIKPAPGPGQSHIQQVQGIEPGSGILGLVYLHERPGKGQFVFRWRQVDAFETEVFIEGHHEARLVLVERDRLVELREDHRVELEPLGLEASRGRCVLSGITIPRRILGSGLYT